MPRFVRFILSNAPYWVIITLLMLAPQFITNLYHLQVMTFIGIYVILALSLNLLKVPGWWPVRAVI
jgi:ABC-type branched-subunit amino acid transport system permease subunit